MDDDDLPPTTEELWSRANDITLPAAVRAENWYHLAQHSWFEQQFNECIAYAEMSEKFWRDAGYTEDEGEAAYWQGRANLRVNQPQKAIDCFERAIECHHSIGNDRLQADALYAAAQAHQALENTDEALVLFESSSRFYVAAECDGPAGDARLEMGEIRGSRGDITEALRDFTAAREHFAKAQSSSMAHRATDRMASAHIELGQLDEAIRLLRENIDLAVFLENPMVLAFAQYRLGWTLTISEDYVEAMTWLDLARAFYSSHGHSDHYKAEVDCYRIEALRALGRNAEATQVGRGLRAYWRSVGNYARLTLFDANDAFELAMAKDFVEARRLAAAAAKRAKQECGDWVERIARLTMAEIEILAGFPENARDALESDLAEQWGDSVFNRARHLMVLASVAAVEGRPNEARGITESVIELVEGTHFVGVQGQAYVMLADLAARERDESRARDMRSRAVALFLADGQVARANEIARSLLPDLNTNSRSNEWRLVGAPEVGQHVDDDSRSQSRDMPRSRPRRAPGAEPSEDSRKESNSDAPGVTDAMGVTVAPDAPSEAGEASECSSESHLEPGNDSGTDADAGPGSEPSSPEAPPASNS